MAKALANATENFTVTPNIFAKINDKDRENHLKQVRDQIRGAEGPMRDVGQAVAVAFLAQLCAQRQAQKQGKGRGLPVDRYWDIARTAILGGVTVHGLNMHGPFSR